LQFCRFFALSAKFPVYSGRKQKTPEFPLWGLWCNARNKGGMPLSLYQTVKSAITVRQVGEMYGMEPDRHGMVCCPFHSDNHPSMMLNESYYYCFACGANGDAIDLTAKLFDLNPRQAAAQA
jgi:hypothetical protein